MLKFLFSLSFFLISQISSHEILVKTSSDDYVTIEVNEANSFLEVMEQIEYNLSLYGDYEPAEISFEFSTPSQILKKKSSSTTRNYSHIPTPAEREDINYIVRTLASGSWSELLKQKSSLKKAGDRVDHVHPLRFLAYILSDEQLKGGLHTIHDRSKVWKEFFGGLSESLQEESKKSNIKQEYLQEFANNVKVDLNAIMPAVQSQDWNKFVALLLQNLPRSGNPGRYDM